MIKAANISIFILLLSISTNTIATDFYVCDCATGADSDCINGDDAANGSLQTPWQSYEKTRTIFSTIAAGDSIKFCDGGYWSINGAGNRWNNTNCQAAINCTIDNYVSTWSSGDEVNPILERLDGGTMFAFEDGGNANHEEGYLIQNLTIKGTNSGRGFLFYNDIDDVTLKNLDISNFNVGIEIAGSNQCDPNDINCDGNNDRITLSNSTITNNHEQGLLGGSSGGLILNNYFSDNGNRFNFDHNIYISGHNISNMQVIGNQLYHAALDQNGLCQGASFVVHGVINDLLIENNTIWEDVGFAGPGCWGIAVDAAYNNPETFTNIVIRANTVKNVGNLSIGVSSCVDCVIENNVIIQEQSHGSTIIAAPDRLPGTGDAETDRVIIRNNSIYLNNGNAGGDAIKVNSFGNSGRGHIITNNAIVYDGSTDFFNCFTLVQHDIAFSTIDNNICYHPNSTGSQWAPGFPSLIDWQTTAGFDNNSSEQNPGFLDIANSLLSASNENSIMINTGHPNLSSNTDILGTIRGIMPDIGAYEWLSRDLVFLNSFE